jgi:hypothetical protein
VCFINKNLIKSKSQSALAKGKCYAIWCSKKKYMKALAEIIKEKISERKEFFGVKI